MKNLLSIIIVIAITIIASVGIYSLKKEGKSDLIIENARLQKENKRSKAIVDSINKIKNISALEFEHYFYKKECIDAFYAGYVSGATTYKKYIESDTRKPFDKFSEKYITIDSLKYFKEQQQFLQSLYKEYGITQQP